MRVPGGRTPDIIVCSLTGPLLSDCREHPQEELYPAQGPRHSSSDLAPKFTLSSNPQPSSSVGASEDGSLPGAVKAPGWRESDVRAPTFDLC